MKKVNISSGFTLIELMIAILVLVIIIAIATPYFSSMLARMESKKISTSLQTILRDARHHAFTHRKRIAICGSYDGINCDSQGWNTGLLIFHDAIPNRIRDETEKIHQFYQLNLKHGHLTWKGFGVAGNIIFQADTGLPRGSNGSFFYCADQSNNTRRIFVTPMGHSRIESHQC